MKYYLKFLGLLTAGLWPFLVEAQNIPNIDFSAVQKQMEKISDGEFRSMDKDNDGKVSLEEYQDYLIRQTLASSSQTFKRLDKNGDGSISAEEYNQFMDLVNGQLNGLMKNLKSQKEQLEKLNQK